MLGILRNLAERFDKKTAEIEAETVRLRERARQLAEQNECVNRETEEIRQDTENIRLETSELFNTLVVEIATAIENAHTAEQRETFRQQAVRLHSVLSLN